MATKSGRGQKRSNRQSRQRKAHEDDVLPPPIVFDLSKPGGAEKLIVGAGKGCELIKHGTVTLREGDLARWTPPRLEDAVALAHAMRDRADRKPRQRGAAVANKNKAANYAKRNAEILAAFDEKVAANRSKFEAEKYAQAEAVRELARQYNIQPQRIRDILQQGRSSASR